MFTSFLALAFGLCLVSFLLSVRIPSRTALCHDGVWYRPVGGVVTLPAEAAQGLGLSPSGTTRKGARESETAASASGGGSSDDAGLRAELRAGPLPETFPHRDKLIAAGLDTIGAVEDADTGTLLAIEGIGPTKAAEIDRARSTWPQANTPQ